jgi:NADH-quinone oxidoreductase subunit L
MINLSAWVLLLPLAGFVVLGLGGKFLPRPVVTAIAWGACGLAFLLAAINFFSLLGTPVAARTSDLVLYNWVTSGSLQVSFGLLLDPLSATMLMIVTGVGFLIHIYSAGYMSEDPGFWRFFAFLNFFIFSMVMLVVADNFLFLLVGWGLVGLASFLLIGFWYQRPSAVAAAKKAFVINVIGDFGLMLAIFMIFKYFGALNYFSNASGVGVLSAAHGTGLLSRGVATAICLLLFVACAAKSAQLPLYMWLPDAMEGPTPVSALIHAATMVTAGVYLVARTNALFELAPLALSIVAAIGGITALFAATIAVFQLDIKRVLAYSTISQLGYMFMSEGVHNYTGGIFHLTTHAYFKALLFLGAGAVIHSLDGEQDMRAMGGLRNKMKITFATFMVAALAISGIPPFAGFWSKDEILSSILAQAQTTHSTTGSLGLYALWIVGLLTAGLTAFYMFRLVFGIFYGEYRGSGLTHASTENEEEGYNQTHLHIHEAPAIMWVPLAILGILSVIGGLYGSFSLIGLPTWHPLETLLAPVFAGAHAPEVSLGVQWISTSLSVLLGALGIFGAWRLYGRGFEYKENNSPAYQLVFHKYYVDEILDTVMIKPLQALMRAANRILEQGALDGGSRGIATIFQGTSSGLRKLQTGFVRNYALAILVGVVLIIMYYAVRA